jgi:hypothetical protein
MVGAAILRTALLVVKPHGYQVSMLLSLNFILEVGYLFNYRLFREL